VIEGDVEVAEEESEVPVTVQSEDEAEVFMQVQEVA